MLGADREIHRAANGGNRIRSSRMPVGEVAGDRDLKRAEHTVVQMAAAHHRKRIGGMEERGTEQGGHRLLARIDQIGILRARFRRRSHAEQPVFGVQDDLAIPGQVVRHHRGQADAEIHVRAIRNVARDTRGDLLAAETFHRMRLQIDDPVRRPRPAWP